MTIFFDTNILVYAVSTDTRSVRARSCLAGGGKISVQVLNELTNILLKKSKFGWVEIDGILAGFSIRFPDPLPITALTHTDALGLAKVHNVPIYDALIIASAIEADCTMLFSEDMQHGRKFGQLTIVNPFRAV
jgi:predicted nucleic acid-binding protein